MDGKLQKLSLVLLLFTQLILTESLETNKDNKPQEEICPEPQPYILHSTILRSICSTEPQDILRSIHFNKPQDETHPVPQPSILHSSILGSICSNKPQEEIHSDPQHNILHSSILRSTRSVVNREKITRKELSKCDN